MTELFGSDVARLIDQSMSRGLIPGTLFRAVAKTTRSTLTGGFDKEETEIFKFRGIAQFYRDNEVDNELIKHSDRKILIIAKSLDTVPLLGDKITLETEDDTYSIIRINRDPAQASYICQARL